jgi:hypothetical protein
MKTRRKSVQSDDRRKVIASFKGTDEFADWVERLAAFMRLPKSTMIEHGLIALASAQGFEEAPPER